MSLTQHPRLIARVAGASYLIITTFALFAYMYVRGEVIFPDDMAKTAVNVVAQEHLYRLGISAAVIVVVANLPLGVLLYELLRVVDSRIALLALVFIIASTIIEAVNLMNYMAPLFTFTLPDVIHAFALEQRQGLARVPIRMWGYFFSVSLVFFGVFCALTGYLIMRSTFLPRLLGLLMVAAGACYWLNSFGVFLALPDIPYLFNVTMVAENGLALWLFFVGVNDTKWRAQAAAAQ